MLGEGAGARRATAVHGFFADVSRWEGLVPLELERAMTFFSSAEIFQSQGRAFVGHTCSCSRQRRSKNAFYADQWPSSIIRML